MVIICTPNTNLTPKLFPSSSCFSALLPFATVPPLSVFFRLTDFPAIFCHLRAKCRLDLGRGKHSTYGGRRDVISSNLHTTLIDRLLASFQMAFEFRWLCIITSNFNSLSENQKSFLAEKLLLTSSILVKKEVEISDVTWRVKNDKEWAAPHQLFFAASNLSRVTSSLYKNKIPLSIQKYIFITDCKTFGLRRRMGKLQIILRDRTFYVVKELENTFWKGFGFGWWHFSKISRMIVRRG